MTAAGQASLGETRRRGRRLSRAFSPHRPSPLPNPRPRLRPAAGNPRALTCILYLNDGWDVGAHGGALRAYPPRGGGEAPRYVDVAPVGGRLLLFDSVAVEHEVRPTYAPRMAITLWCHGAPPAG